MAHAFPACEDSKKRIGERLANAQEIAEERRKSMSPEALKEAEKRIDSKHLKVIVLFLSAVAGLSQIANGQGVTAALQERRVVLFRECHIFPWPLRSSEGIYILFLNAVDEDWMGHVAGLSLAREGFKPWDPNAPCFDCPPGGRSKEATCCASCER